MEKFRRVGPAMNKFLRLVKLIRGLKLSNRLIVEISLFWSFEILLLFITSHVDYMCVKLQRETYFLRRVPKVD